MVLSVARPGWSDGGEIAQQFDQIGFALNRDAGVVFDFSADVADFEENDVQVVGVGLHAGRIVTSERKALMVCSAFTVLKAIAPLHFPV